MKEDPEKWIVNAMETINFLLKIDRWYFPPPFFWISQFILFF